MTLVPTPEFVTARHIPSILQSDLGLTTRKPRLAMETHSELVGHPASLLFDVVAAKDHEALLKIYAANARNSLLSFMSMKVRLARQQEFYSNAGT